MLITTKAIVFSSLKYGDTSLIVKAYTKAEGLKSYMLKGVLASKKGKLKTAYFQPLTQLEIVANQKPNSNLHSIKEVKVYYHYQTLHTQVSKNALTLFLAEILGNSIHEEENNPALFNFLEAALQWLDTHSNVANFHICFLLVLTKYLGFYPDDTNFDGVYFDLLEGQFVHEQSLNPIVKGSVIKFLKELLGMNFDEMLTIKMNKKSRQELLNALVLYFELHLQGFRKPKSLAILQEVFS